MRINEITSINKKIEKLSVKRAIDGEYELIAIDSKKKSVLIMRGNQDDCDGRKEQIINGNDREYKIK